jgi:hypothetical protein
MRIFFATLLWMAVSTLAFGQLPGTTINGRVTDSQGASVSAARVTLTNDAQGTSRQALTNAAGFFVFSSLDAGAYRLRVESLTFARTEIPSLLLEAGKVHTVDVELKPAGANAVVNVASVIESVDISQSMIQGQITSNVIEKHPLEW